MKSLDAYVDLTTQAHGHMCAGQILGLRIAIYGMKLLDIEDPTGRDRKRLVTFVEIDRCATDAIFIVTGCRLGKRALKFRDFGKVAATFCDLQVDRAVRVRARETSKQRAKELYPEITDKNQQQLRADRELADAELFAEQRVKVTLGAEEFPGYKGDRCNCDECGEGINCKREVILDGHVRCKACAGERYYTPL
jgi:formylmethanofuran dehydrogenase subunit E